MKTRILINEGTYRLSKAGVMDAKHDAEELYCFLRKCDRVVLFLHRDDDVDEETENAYFELIGKRASRTPLQHITGMQEFMGFEFEVSPGVLIPRQDTETLVTEAAKAIKKSREERRNSGSFFRKLRGNQEYELLDLCCGSGIVGISLAKICEGINVTAADISDEAVKLTAKNSRSNRTELTVYRGDMFEALKGGERIKPNGVSQKRTPPLKKKFDMIVSNPPYIRTNIIPSLQEEVKNHEPREALDGGRDGLKFYRIIVSEASEWLKPRGWLMMEIGYDQGEDLRKMILDSGKYTKAEVVKDLPGKDRVVKCQKQADRF